MRSARSVLAPEQSRPFGSAWSSNSLPSISTDDAAAWAHRNLAAKNTLTAADAQIVEERFQARLSTISDGLDPSEPPNILSVENARPAGRNDAPVDQKISTEIPVPECAPWSSKLRRLAVID